MGEERGMKYPHEHIPWFYLGIFFGVVGLILFASSIFLLVFDPGPTLAPDTNWCTTTTQIQPPWINVLPTGAAVCLIFSVLCLGIHLMTNPGDTDPSHFKTAEEHRQKCAHHTVCKLSSCPEDCEEYMYIQEE